MLMPKKNDKVYTTNNLAKRLSLSIETVRYKIRMGQIEAYNLNKNGKKPIYRVTEASLQNYLSKCIVD